MERRSTDGAVIDLDVDGIGDTEVPACRTVADVAADADSLDEDALEADATVDDDDFLFGAIMPRASAKLVPMELSISSTGIVFNFFSIGAPCDLRSLEAEETSPSARRLLADEGVDGLSECDWC